MPSLFKGGFPFIVGGGPLHPAKYVLLHACGDELFCVVEKGIEGDVADAHGDGELDVGDTRICCRLMCCGSKVDTKESLIGLGIK